MPTQSKTFKVLFLAVCCLVILMSFLAVSSRGVPQTSTVSHRIVSAGSTLSTFSEHRNAVSAVACLLIEVASPAMIDRASLVPSPGIACTYRGTPIGHASRLLMGRSRFAVMTRPYRCGRLQLGSTS